MTTADFRVADAGEIGIDAAKLNALLERASREVRDGLLPSAQLSIARHGRLAAMRTFGAAVQGGEAKPATNATLYSVFSCTKAIVAAAIWILIGEGRLDPAEHVADIIEGFGAKGKDVVTAEHLLMHTGGFPAAPMPIPEWFDRTRRLARFASSRLDWPPGSRFVYHPTAGFWALAEIIERRTGEDFRDFIRDRISRPLNLRI